MISLLLKAILYKNLVYDADIAVLKVEVMFFKRHIFCSVTAVFSKLDRKLDRLKVVLEINLKCYFQSIDFFQSSTTPKSSFCFLNKNGFGKTNPIARSSIDLPYEQKQPNKLPY